MIYFIYKKEAKEGAKLELKKKQINLEYGKEFKADFDTLVDTKGLNKEDKEYLKKNS